MYKNTRVRLHAAGVRKLRDIRSGFEAEPVQEKGDESIFEVPLQPVFYRAFKLIR